ncbi:MAG: DDE-type integrase/transposase/recombinase, partial [Erysipelotrichaceae bacterium]|nr:DDE-type integrase/transposase/recombinase [Erysipelotrichaceae bacterium]
MKEKGLVSNYTVKQFKLHKPTYNNDLIKNELNRNFKQKERMNVIVSDLTYVNVNGKWNYICTIIDLYNREIVGYAASKNKDAKLVKKAINSINYDLSKIILFHADRGNEFKNQMIDDVLETFDIRRSLIAKGCPYDNAVAEATYKIFKTEFAFNRRFKNFE